MSAFVSRDGADGNGVRAEVYVQTGTGKIIKVEGKNDPDKKNVQVHVESSLANVRHAIKGWLAKNDPLFAEVVAAHESGREIEYRVEAQRKASVDRALPIMPLRETTELARENTKSIFAGLDGTLSQEAVTNPREDQASGRIRATDSANNAGQPGRPAAGAAFTVEQALTGLATARSSGLDDGVVNTLAAFALMAGASPQQVAEAGVSVQTPAGAQQPPRRAFATEAAPHIARNSDGRTNLGSYAVTAAFGADKVARDILTRVNEEAFTAHNEAVAAGTVEGEPMVEPEPVDAARAVVLAKILLGLADRVQVGAYGGGRPNRMGNSHTRARSLVYDAVQTRHAMPIGSTAEEQEAWKEAVVADCVERFKSLAEIAIEVESVPAPAGEAASEGATVTEIAPARAARAAGKPPVEGQDGFVAPAKELIARFGALAEAAGFEPKPDSPVKAYVESKFGVALVRQVHGPALDRLVAWFESKGDEGVAKFRQQVEQAATQAAA